MEGGFPYERTLMAGYFGPLSLTNTAYIGDDSSIFRYLKCLVDSMDGFFEDF